MHKKYLIFPLLGLLSLTALIPPARHMHAAPHAAAAETCTFSFVQGGDPQLGGRSGLTQTQRRFDEFIDQMNRQRPDFVLLVGDLVNDQDDPAQWAAFQRSLSRLQVPAKMLCGNHDDLATFRRICGPDYYSFTHKGSEFVCLNSNFMNAVRGDWKREADEQWAWLERTLARVQAEGRENIFIALHHPPQLLLPGSRMRLEHLIQQYNIQVVLAGHTHRTDEFPLSTYTAYTVAGTGWCQDKDGFGYRTFNVWTNQCQQQYTRLTAAFQQ